MMQMCQGSPWSTLTGLAMSQFWTILAWETTEVDCYTLNDWNFLSPQGLLRQRERGKEGGRDGEREKERASLRRIPADTDGVTEFQEKISFLNLPRKNHFRWELAKDALASRRKVTGDRNFVQCPQVTCGSLSKVKGVRCAFTMGVVVTATLSHLVTWCALKHRASSIKDPCQKGKTGI